MSLLLYASFWVIPRRQNFIRRRFITLFHRHRQVGMNKPECSETSAHKILAPGNYPEESIQHSEHGESLLQCSPRQIVGARRFQLHRCISCACNWSLKKGKAVPLQAWSGPEGCRKLRFPDYMTTAQDGVKVVSLTHRTPSPPGNTPGTHFC